MVGVDGSQLSGGEKQWVALMRLLHHPQPLLLLDEATANMDLETEKMALEVMRKLLSGERSVFMIAHRLATLDLVDRVLQLSDGTICYDGSAKEFVREGFDV